MPQKPGGLWNQPGGHYVQKRELLQCFNFLQNLKFIYKIICTGGPFLHGFWFGGRTLHMLCLLGPLWSVYKGYFKIPLFSSSSVFLMVLNPPSGVENSNVKNPLLSYIKSCVLTCTLRIWTSFVVFCFLQCCQFLPLFETLSQILLR